MRDNLIITGFWTAHALLGLLGKRDADVGPAGPVFSGRSDLHFGSSSEVKHGFCWWWSSPKSCCLRTDIYLETMSSGHKKGHVFDQLPPRMIQVHLKTPWPDLIFARSPLHTLKFWTWISQVHRTHIKKWIAVGFCFCCFCCCCCCRCLLLFLRGRIILEVFLCWFPEMEVPPDHPLLGVSPWTMESFSCQVDSPFVIRLVSSYKDGTIGPGPLDHLIFCLVAQWLPWSWCRMLNLSISCWRLEVVLWAELANW